MTWDYKVNVQVLLGSAQQVDRAVFNVPLHLVGDASFPELVRTYASPTEAAQDTLLGSTGLAAVNAHFEQEISAQYIKIGRVVDTPVAQVVTWSIGGTPVENETYTITINGIRTDYVAGAAPTIASVHAALLSAVSTNVTDLEITIAGSSPDITATGDNAGEVFEYYSAVTPAPGQEPGGTMAEALTTAAEGINSDLDKIWQADDGWYGLTTAVHPDGATNLSYMKQAGAWAQINKKLYLAQSSDADVLAGTAGNDLLELRAANRSRVAYLYHHTNLEKTAVAWMSHKFGGDLDVEQANWAYRPLEGISIKSPRINTTERINVTDNYGNLFMRFGGNPKAGMGISTTGKRLDIIETQDWLEARLSEANIQLLSDFAARGQSIGLNDTEFEVIKSANEKVVSTDAVNAKHLNEGTTKVEVVQRSAMTDADVQDRLVRVTASGQLRGSAEQISVVMTVYIV